MIEHDTFTPGIFQHRIGSFVDGVGTLQAAAAKLRAEADYLDCMIANGYELTRPVTDNQVVAATR